MEKPKQVDNVGRRENPEQIPTDQPSLFDLYESERTVDPIPLEDQKISQQDEKHKERTKSSSGSERKYERGY
ncbi:hypothetical protein SAMN02799630_05947 [Paenibacillus sp. UNCCL117]|uniref:hypothetical protein n=1 Tax=unclassified Paenibacillus TaxID=185978 RepID=UPI00088B7E84|nr:MULTISPECIES: hypothetical protein [unclassified Paenibacillus]SDE62137.1 hypothetical protein SAMN04488602_13628 [Paenibacillus sp. cl123]SFW69885.1 hypothetical protein SAMN02799630_05947 [Paenibacillus sp. UNCCL117]